jgi:uncharacterized protein
MKYLLVFALVLVGLWVWRNNRRADSGQTNKNSARRPMAPHSLPTEIVACDVCHVHLPRAEALTGPGGVYCSAAHRQQAEG